MPQNEALPFFLLKKTDNNLVFLPLTALHSMCLVHTTAHLLQFTAFAERTDTNGIQVYGTQRLNGHAESVQPLHSRHTRQDTERPRKIDGLTQKTSGKEQFLTACFSLLTSKLFVIVQALN